MINTGEDGEKQEKQVIEPMVLQMGDLDRFPFARKQILYPHTGVRIENKMQDFTQQWKM